MPLILLAALGFLAYKMWFAGDPVEGGDQPQPGDPNFTGPVAPMGPSLPDVLASVLPGGGSSAAGNAPDAGQPVVTEATVVEAPMSLRFVQPRKQPAAPAPDAMAAAQTMAPQLEQALVTNADAKNYRNTNPGLVQMVQQFQHALNLTPDGLYGPTTAGALMYFLGHGPPPPFFYLGERVVNLYAPV